MLDGVTRTLSFLLKHHVSVWVKQHDLIYSLTISLLK